jgi:integrase
MAQYSRKLSAGIRWFWKFDINGKTCYSKCIYHSKKEASQAERERYSELDEERRLGKQDMPYFLKVCIADRLKFLGVKYSESHKEDSEAYLDLFLEFVGDQEIREIVRKDIEDFLLDYSEKCQKKGRDNYQVNAALKTIKSLFNHIIENNELSMTNPANKIKPYSVRRKLKYIPLEDDIKKLKGFLNERQRLLIDFLMETGARVNEGLSLTFDDLKGDYIILYTNKSKNSDREPRNSVENPLFFERVHAG